MSKRLGLILISIIFILGCAVTPTKIRTTPFEVFKASYDDIWAKTISYLETNKEPIILADKTTGDIQTDWVITKWFWNVKRYRYLIKIKGVTADTTSVTVETPFESYAEGSWELALPTEAKSNALFNVLRPKAETTKPPTAQSVKPAPAKQTTERKQEKQPIQKTEPAKNFQTK